MNWADINKAQVGMAFVLAMVTLFLIILLYVWHRHSDNKIDLKDLVCSRGQLDEKKFVRFGAWIVSTWGFVYLIVDERFSEWYFMGYMTAWVGNAILDKYFTLKVSPPAPPTVETKK